MWQRGELIGEGSFGRVYSGLELTSGKRIAVKELTLSSGKKLEDQARLVEKEVKLMSELRHHNIILYLGTEQIRNTVRIFMELATEGSLKEALKEFGGLSEIVIRKYCHDICSGLAYLHSCNVIHRDIKPSNLLISAGVIKIADMGCSAHFLGQGTADASNHTVAGTTIYMLVSLLVS